MAEVAGLVIGGVGLAALFTTCVDCFEYVQLGRQFGDRYGRCLLEIDVLKLRLSRWGATVNQLQPVTNQDDVETVKRLLSDIIHLFARAEDIATDFKSKNIEKKLLVYDENADLDAKYSTMRQSMKQLALKRQNRAGFTQKAKWALYKHGDFEYLIEHVTKHVESLEALYASTNQLQQNLRTEDAKALSDEPGLEMLEEVVEDIDPAFQNSIKEVIASKEGHRFINNSTTDKASTQLGDYVAKDYTGNMEGGKHHYEGNRASQNAKVMYGNNYGGKSVFDG
jgi:hypothetical protein